jgi:hypothetical protein
MKTLSNTEKAALVCGAALRMRNDRASTIVEREAMEAILGLGEASQVTLYDALNETGYFSRDE